MCNEECMCAFASLGCSFDLNSFKQNGAIEK